MNKNEIFLNRKCKVILAAGSSQLPLAYVGSVLKNLESLGFTASPALIERLQTLDEAALHAFLDDVVPGLQKMVGAHRTYAPLYPNFPQQVMDATDAEIYINALMHYLGDRLGLRLLPRYEKAPRTPLAQGLELKVIDLGTEEEFMALFRNLLAAGTSISETDKYHLSRVLSLYRENIEAIIPEAIPHKEILSFLGATLITQNSPFADTLLSTKFRTATDVLRLAVRLCKGDESLAKPTKFRKMKRSIRRILLMLVDRIDRPLEDMYRHRGAWLRLGEALHPGEHAEKFPKALTAFSHLRTHRAFKGFHARVEAEFAAKNRDQLIKILSQRPGEFARILDRVLRNFAESAPILTAFGMVAGEVATPVLLQVAEHFRRRTGPAPDARYFLPKGQLARIIEIPNQLPRIDPSVCQQLVDICELALLERFRSRGALGNVYIDPRLKNYFVPFSQRSASKTLRTLVRGTRVPLPAGRIVRLFLWWSEGKVNGVDTGRVDIDLSACIYSSEWQNSQIISFQNLRDDSYRAYHSGDITSAPNGAAEFIDFDIDPFVNAGGRYLLPMAFCFTSHKFADLPECFMGWMSRSEPHSGEVFEPRTVVDRVDMAGDQRVYFPAIIDLKTREIIWADLSLKETPSFANVAESKVRNLGQMARGILGLHKPNLYDLFMLHAKVRGTLVASLDEADTVFSPEKGLTPFDFEKIVSLFL